MEVRLKVGLALVLGAAGGLLAGQALHAQSKPHAYFVADVQEITDGAKFGESVKKTGPLIEGHGGKYIVRGQTVVGLTGTPPQRLAIAEFANMDAAKAWADDPKTKAAVGELDQYSKQRRFLVEGTQ